MPSSQSGSNSHQSKPVLNHQQRKSAKRHPEHRAGAAADRDAADDDRGDDGQLEAERHSGVNRRVARRPQRAVKTRQ